MKGFTRISPLVVLLLCIASVWLAGCGTATPSDPEILARLPEQVDYNYHIKPLLSDRCYTCHGPDENARKANLQLHNEAGAKDATLESGGHAIVAGSLRRSTLFARITSDDPEEVMPPPTSNLTLTEYEKALIARWIDQGAVWKPHWAFIPPERPEVPEITKPAWSKNSIDAFVLARLNRERLSPSPEADKERLLRRVTFDLTGLPPTLDAVDTFLADERPDAYERVVDSLLASEAYGERMASEWMDVARYADSHGYHADGIRMMWPWRDWVIKAFNDNMPFDQFVTWQLAGDLLPDATLEQKLATGFHRNHPMTAEGGIIDEEYRLEYVFDRTNTTARAFLGLTMECARCHDHKFDPLSQREFFQFSAFFNNVDELGLTGDDGNAGPMLMLLDDAEDQQLDELRAQIAEQRVHLKSRETAVAEAGLHRDTSIRSSTLSQGLDAHYPLDELGVDTTPNVSQGEAARVTGEPEVVEGPRGQAFQFDNDYDNLYLGGEGHFERTDPFTVSTWIHPEEQGAYAVILGNAHQKNTYWRGWELFLDSLNHVSARLIHALPHNLLHVRTQAKAPTDSWTHIAFTYDGSSSASGLKLYIDGQKAPLVIEYDNLYKSILPVNYQHFQPTKRPVRVARSYRAFGGDDGIFTGSLDDIRLYDRTVTAAEVAYLYMDNSPTPTDAEALEYYLHHVDPEYRTLLAQLKDYRDAEQAHIADVPEVMVMEEMETPRPTYVLDRGIYDQPREQVEPGTPERLGGFPENLPPNRLGLAEWILSPDNPLTARVTVNRYWQLYFGQGIVNTPQDFGNQGALPTHPALLDWLALTFVDSGWDVKALQRLIVTSATYRQSSKASPERLAQDPSNALLARGPRHRLSAEMIRDNALAASGLLVNKVGGPSVKPYQPPGLWIEKGNFSAALLRYEPDTGDDLYRRSLYTFIRRTSPPPSMTVFDAPDRTTCMVQRQNTNTPLQALVLMNDPQYVEAARMLAERMQREGGADLEAQIAYGFRLTTGRHPTSAEVDLLARFYEAEHTNFTTTPARADSLLAVGEYPRDPTLSKTETAALAMLAGLLINHDEAYTKR